LYTLWFIEAGMPGAYRLKEGDTLIGRGPLCDLIVTSTNISRKHARVRLKDDRVFLSDAGSRHGTLVKGAPIAAEYELASGDSFVIGSAEFTITRDMAEDDVLSDQHEVFEDGRTIVRQVENKIPEPAGPPVALSSPRVTVSSLGDTPSAGRPAPETARAPLAVPSRLPPGERRVGQRRKVNLGRALGERRSGRDRRGGRILRLLTEISKTLVTVQPIEQVLARVVDLVFDSLPAERVFLLLRDTWDQPLTARVLRNRDGSAPINVSISRTIVSKVMRDRVAILAKDARIDARLDVSNSIQALNIRSFMCAPLWNRNDVTGVLYCDNPRSRQFSEEDLEVFTALSNYAAVAIEQARLSQQIIEETKRRERLQRYHSPAVVSSILQSEASEQDRFITQERDVTVMFTDIVGFTKLCERLEPAAIGEMLNEHFGRMAEIIFEHEGTLDKFIGDAILAVFGAPLEELDHAERCVSAALEMRATLQRINAERGGPPIQMRYAICTGRALTGDIGSPKRKEFTTLGDVVNTASRLESTVAQPDQIVISDTTRQRLGSAFQVRSLGTHPIRGREAAVEVFEVLG
jgi:adenylate cyclase